MKTLFLCDRPEHGYDCFHLEETLPGFSDQEKEQWKSFEKEWGFDYEKLEQVDEAIQEARRDYDHALEEADEAEEEIQALEDYKQLLQKKLR